MMFQTHSALIFFSLWLSAVSGSIGGVIGMALMMYHMRRINQATQAAATQVVAEMASEPEAAPNRDEMESLFHSLTKINSEIGAGVGRHTEQVEEINQSLENEGSDTRESLIRTAKLLIAANHQLKTDLAAAESQLRDQRELAESFKHQSRTDALTQLLNRRAFEVELKAYLAKLNRENKSFSLLFVDIDHFKRINDVHGHLNGDQVLQTVAQCLQTYLEVPASVSRYGGEEFAVMIPDATGNEALKIAEKLRRAVERLPQYVEGVEVRVTVSIGVTQAVNGDTRAELIERSDRALFTAKHAGRNQCFYEVKKHESASDKVKAVASQSANDSVSPVRGPFTRFFSRKGQKQNNIA